MGNRRQPFISDFSFVLDNNPNWKKKIAMYRRNEWAVQQNIVSRTSKNHHRSISQSMDLWRTTHQQNSVSWTHHGAPVSQTICSCSWVVCVYLSVYWNGFLRNNSDQDVFCSSAIEIDLSLIRFCSVSLCPQFCIVVLHYFGILKGQNDVV
jgi:hypothetical protein